VLTLLPLTHWEGALISSALYWAGTASLPVMSAHVAAAAPRAQLGRAMGAVYGTFFAGFIIASPLAGTVAARLGFHAAILIGAAFFAASITVALRLGPGLTDPTAGTGRFPRSFWLLLALTPLGSFVAVLPTPLHPVYVRDIAGSPLELVGVYVACVSLGSAIFSAAGGRLADRFGAAPAVIVNSTILVMGCMIAALLASSGILVAIGLVLVGANVASNPVLAAMLERIVPPSRAALGYAAFQLAYGSGFGIGGVVAGVLYDADAHLPLLATAALGLPVAVVVSLVVMRIARAPAPDAHAS
jgi:MFS family permease